MLIIGRKWEFALVLTKASFAKLLTDIVKLKQTPDQFLSNVQEMCVL